MREVRAREIEKAQRAPRRLLNRHRRLAQFGTVGARLHGVPRHGSPKFFVNHILAATGSFTRVVPSPASQLAISLIKRKSEEDKPKRVFTIINSCENSR